MKETTKCVFIAIILFAIIYSIIVGFMLREDRLEETNKLLKENKHLLEDNRNLKEWNMDIASRYTEVCDRELGNQKAVLLTLAYAYDNHKKIIRGLLCEENCEKTKEEFIMDYSMLGYSGEDGRRCDNTINNLVEEANEAGFLGICY